MKTLERDEVARLRKECHWLGATAVLLMSLGLGASLPKVLERRRELQRGNQELLSLQASITATQVQLHDVETRIMDAQNKLKQTLDGHHH